MKLLLLSDKPNPVFWDFYRPGRLDSYDLILSAGDLDPEYLTFLVTMSHAPVLYIHGNHDASYDARPPEGCECIDDRLIQYRGLRIVGLGGSALYNNGPYQYTERQMRQRIRRLNGKVRRAKGVDLVLTHAAPHGYCDDSDYAHRGFEAFLPMLDRWNPKALVHGHIHLMYGIPREQRYRETRILNAYESVELDMDVHI